MSLGTKQVENVMDTIVMANLGYLQLKSSPGRWLLKLRQGRSDELYDIVSIDGKIFRHNKFQYSREQKHVLLFRKSEIWLFKVSITNMPHIFLGTKLFCF